MKIEAKAGPALSSENNAQTRSAAQTARERAIARVMANGAPQTTTPEVIQTAQVAPSQEPSQQETPVNSDPSEGQVDNSGPTQEAPKADTKAPEEPISSQYAVLARKEKAFRAKIATEQAALKAEREAIERERAELAQKAQSYERDYIPKARLSEDTINALLEAGVDYDKVTEMALQQAQTPQDPRILNYIKKLEEKLSKLEGDQETFKKSTAEQQQNAYNEAVNTIRRDVKDMVSQGNDFEAIRVTNSVDEVVKLIEKTYEADGVLLSNEEAAKMVEEELISRISEYAKISKLQQKNSAPAKVPPQTQGASQPTQDKQSQPVKTLSNNMTPSGKKLTARERAVLAFEGKLGK